MRGRMPLPRRDRKEADTRAVVRLSTGVTVPVRVSDTSEGGCVVRCLHALPVGAIVQLEVPACQPSAVNVRWSVGGKAGLKFVY